MPGNGELSPQVWQLLQLAIGIFGSAGFAAWFIGWLTHRRAVRSDHVSEDRQDRQDEVIGLRNLASTLGVENERLRRHLHETIIALEAARLDRSHVWVAARRMEDAAHRLRHDANGRIDAAFKAGDFIARGITLKSDGTPMACPAAMPEVPSLESFLPADGRPAE